MFQGHKVMTTQECDFVLQQFYEATNLGKLLYLYLGPHFLPKDARNWYDHRKTGEISDQGTFKKIHPSFLVKGKCYGNDVT